MYWMKDGDFCLCRQAIDSKPCEQQKGSKIGEITNDFLVLLFQLVPAPGEKVCESESESKCKEEKEEIGKRKAKGEKM